MTAPAPPARPSSLVERLAEEMMDRWRAGGRPRVEEFLTRYPNLRDRPDVVLELIAEEIALRGDAGEDVPAAELVARFPAWRVQVEALLACQRVLGPATPGPLFPAPGDVLGEFRLVAELGRGAHGRVYLATQPALADRPVVLKLGPAAGSEHLSLARLQHTHIVPLYSAHEFPAAGLRALCLPYFGGATFADLLAAAARGTAPRTGADLRAALAAAPVPAGVPVPPPGPACALLERVSFVEAVCWIGACLADALQYAHDRGLLHLDLKPSNVLLAADGVPMLLDFHLARPPLRGGDPAPTWIGGTPGYMPPEQLAALDAVRTGGAIPVPVDARADVYALGVLLAEAVGRPAARPGGDPPLSVGLADVLARCTDPDAAGRYATAADLAGDLRRHMADLPLKGVRNRSFAERWRKWRRRRPYALSLVLAVAATAATGSGLILHTDRQADRAWAALGEGEEHLRQGRAGEAAEAFRSAEALAQGVPFRRDLTARLRATRQAADRGLAADKLHTLCEQVRPMYAAETLAPEEARAVVGHCRALWAEREVIARRLDGQSSPDLERRWRADLLDLGILTAHLDAGLAPPGETAGARRRALDTLAQAEALLGASGVLYLERATHARALGLTVLAEDAERRAAATGPRTAWEYLAVGRAHLGAGDPRRAAADLDRALDLDPRALWANYYKGACCLKLRDPAGALAAFSACIVLAPQSAWCYFNRGLAHTELGRHDDARADFARATRIDPALAAVVPGKKAGL